MATERKDERGRRADGGSAFERAPPGYGDGGIALGAGGAPEAPEERGDALSEGVLDGADGCERG
ncbi:MAG: hypothetical protein WEE64_13880 [Dehalococcoidia bacterium]